MNAGSPHISPRRHLLGIDGLTRPEADAFLDAGSRWLKELRSGTAVGHQLSGHTVVNLFFEPSTRTQTSFEIAAKRLGAEVVNVSAKGSSMAKGETLRDTAATLDAMGPDAVVTRHGSPGAANFLARELSASIINAGDGAHEHPTQALLDALTLRERLGDLEGRSIAICGDLRHSRVARSSAHLLHLLGMRVRLVAPPTLLPLGGERWGAETVTTNMDEAIANCAAVMMLRMQNERIDPAVAPSLDEYQRFHRLDHDRLLRLAPDAVVMHPGPTNRGVEITAELADDPERSLIAAQVEAGVAVRIAVLERLLAPEASQA